MKLSFRTVPAGVALIALLLAVAGSEFVPQHASAAAIVVDVDSDGAPPDDGDCSLREAIENANADAATNTDCAAGAGNDTITFAGGIAMIALASALPAVSDTDGLTVDGDDSVTISGNGSYYIFGTGNSGAELTLQDLVLTSGGEGAIFNNGSLTLNSSLVQNSNNTSDGGAVANFDSGTATISDTTFNGNSSLSGSGGAISNEGMMTITNSDVTGNSAQMNGGGISNAGGGTLTLNSSTVSNGNAGANGGGIANELGTVTLNDSTVTLSMAQFGAGVFNAQSSTLHIQQASHVDSNTSGNNAGGIANQGTLTVTDSTVNSNKAGFGAGINSRGSVTLTNSTVNQNEASNSGGGIEFAAGTLNVISSEISDNTATNDGGALNSGDLGGLISFTDSTLAGNSAGGNGGAIYSVVPGTTVTFLRSTVNDNIAVVGGGGIRSDAGTLELVNSTVSHNSAQFGGGLYSGDQNTTDLTNVTITANIVPAPNSGGGIYIPGDVTSTVNLRNTIVADQNAGSDCDGTGLVSQGNNLDSSDQCNLIQPSDRPQVDVFLGPLADNGGLTKTHALLPNSNAIDGGDDATCAAAPVSGVDQRGVSRLQGPHCDIGAFELEVPATPTPTPSPTNSPTSTPVQQIELWGDNDCSGQIETADVTRGLLAAGAPEEVEPVTGCPDMGEALAFIDLLPQGAGTLTWGDVHCSQTLDGLDALDVLRHIAGLDRVPLEGFCPEPGDEVVFAAP